MFYAGVARLGKRTKELVKVIGPDDVAIIDHTDVDRISAESLIASGVKVVVDAASSITGTFPNAGPAMLVEAGVHLVDQVGESIFSELYDGQPIIVEGGIVRAGGRPIASGRVLTLAAIERLTADAEAHIDEELELFVSNTVSYLEKEKSKLIYDTWVPQIKTAIADRQVLVVVRGQDYQEDLRILSSYIAEMKPILIGVDGGADALLEKGYRPDIILGDMDSVSDMALRCGAELIAHVYEADDERESSSTKRLTALGLTALRWPISATSEDLALLLAWEKKADLIVALGTHTNLIEYLEKGRKGMSSSFLVRLKVGTKLVDAKGVSKLYRSAPPARYLFLIVAAAIIAMGSTVFVSDKLRDGLTVLWLVIRTNLGF
jgi:uncharacterized membrane-anchored protein